MYLWSRTSEIAAEEDKKRKDKQLLAEQAKRELIEMQDKASKDALSRKGKAAASTATTTSAKTLEEPGRAQNTSGNNDIRFTIVITNSVNVLNSYE